MFQLKILGVAANRDRPILLQLRQWCSEIVQMRYFLIIAPTALYWAHCIYSAYIWGVDLLAFIFNLSLIFLVIIYIY